MKTERADSELSFKFVARVCGMVSSGGVEMVARMASMKSDLLRELGDAGCMREVVQSSCSLFWILMLKTYLCADFPSRLS